MKLCCRMLNGKHNLPCGCEIPSRSPFLLDFRGFFTAFRMTGICICTGLPRYAHNDRSLYLYGIAALRSQ